MGQIVVSNGSIIDSAQFPHTYRLRNTIRSIAIFYRYPPEEAISDFMYLEHTTGKDIDSGKIPLKRSRSKEKRKERYLINALKNIIFSYYRKKYNNMNNVPIPNHNLLSYVEKEVLPGELTESRTVIHARMTLADTKAILKSIDPAIAVMLKKKEQQPDKSWFNVYRLFFRKQISKTKFFENIKIIRKVHKDISEAYTVLGEFLRRQSKSDVLL